MGYVFCAEHTMLGRDFALKILAPERLNDETRRRFELEGKAIANLEHPAIVKVYNMGLYDGDCPYYVMDLLEGLALSDLIAKGPVQFDTVLDIFIQIAAGLGYAHGKGVVHRDVKPSNVVLLPGKDGGYIVKVVDFGIAKLLPSASLAGQSQTAPGDIFGSPFYMSPEQCIGADVDNRSDIYSLGCTFFETLSGQPPYRGQNALDTMMMHEKRPTPSLLQTGQGKTLPLDADIILQKMMAKRPTDRYQSMQQVQVDFERLRKDLHSGDLSLPAIRTQEPADSGDLTPGIFTEGEKVEEKIEPDKANPFPALNPAFWALILIPTCAALIFAGVSLFPQKREPSKQDIAVNTHQSGDLPDDELLWEEQITSTTTSWNALPHIGSTIKTINGKVMREFTFPQTSIGEVFFDNAGETFEACKKYSIPVNEAVGLVIGHKSSAFALYYPDFIKRVGKDEFVILGISGSAHLPENSKYPNGKRPDDGVAFLLETGATWPKLHKLYLETITLNEKALNAISKMANLDQVFLKHVDTDFDKFAQQPFLPKIVCLSLDKIKDGESTDYIGPILRRLARSPRLEVLKIADCTFKIRDLAGLRNCPALHGIYIEPNPGANTDQIISTIAHMFNLQDLEFSGPQLTRAQINRLVALPKLHVLILTVAGGSYPTEEKNYWKATDKRVSFH